MFAGAIAAAYAQIPIGHVEAGLRTYNLQHPFPEEMNRRLTSPLARWNFVPTEVSRQNLLSERIDPSTIHVTGNSVIDALLWMRQKTTLNSEPVAERAKRLGIPLEFAAQFFGEARSETLETRKEQRVSGGGYWGTGEDDVQVAQGVASGERREARESQDGRWILVTGHRRESFGSGFESICEALLEITRQHPDVGILYPVHLNPNVREPVNRLLSDNPRIALIEPVGYEDFIWLMDRCTFLLSDSGGVQEEAPSLGKPVLVMRTTTERPEGVEAGTCRLVGTDKEKILREANLLLSNPDEYAKRSSLQNPYGDGKTAQRITEVLERDLGERG